jgi:hypothetical protein
LGDLQKLKSGDLQNYNWAIYKKTIGRITKLQLGNLQNYNWAIYKITITIGRFTKLLLESFGKHLTPILPKVPSIGL